MKRIVLSMLVVGVVVGLSFSVFAVEVKESTTTKGDTTIEKTEVKSKDFKAKETVKTTPEATTTKEEVKGKNLKIKRTEKQTAQSDQGEMKFKAKGDLKKEGAIKKFDIKWAYNKVGTEYIIKYTLKGKVNKALAAELKKNLTQEQLNAVKGGEHKIVSTSPYTADDVRNDFRAVILKDIAQAARVTAAKKK